MDTNNQQRTVEQVERVEAWHVCIRFGMVLERRAGEWAGNVQCRQFLWDFCPSWQVSPQLAAVLEELWSADATRHHFWHSIWVSPLVHFFIKNG